jgi:16S rRNA (guanine966-N2)-methyltransferase
MGRRKRSAAKASSQPDGSPTRVRIIGGKLRGRWIPYNADPRTRPMKDRVRESVFNLLGEAVAGKHAIDLFAGTGILGLEALSRGAARATLIERHFPTAELIRQTAVALGLEAKATVIACDAFFWIRRQWQPGQEPVIVFCSPPYDYFVSREAEMLELIEQVVQRAAMNSTIVVEADERFNIQALPRGAVWDVRQYPPAVVGLADLPSALP